MRNKRERKNREIQREGEAESKAEGGGHSEISCGSFGLWSSFSMITVDLPQLPLSYISKVSILNDDLNTNSIKNYSLNTAAMIRAVVLKAR